jgi:hypothetical protein
MKVQLVTAYRVSHLQRYGVTASGNVTSVYPPLHAGLRNGHFYFVSRSELFVHFPFLPCVLHMPNNSVSLERRGGIL